MGVPALFRFLSNKYPKIISPVIEEQPQDIDGTKVPIDVTKPNPNGEEFDNLYLDMNGIVHPCAHPEDRPAPTTEEEMMLDIFSYTDRVVNMVRPRKLLMIAVDGVAPRAKMNQQRARRFRAVQEAKEKDEDKAEFIKLLKQQKGDAYDGTAEEAIVKKTWDTNAITPGTPFMFLLAASLRYWCAYKANTDPAWAKMKIIISDASVPGEGEHKIMDFIRSQRSSPAHDPNTRHVIYGLDADLIMLTLATHEPHFRVLREDVFFQEAKARTCRICGQKGHMAEACRGEAKEKSGEFDEKDGGLPEKPFIWLHVSVLREYLEAELYVPSQPFRFDLERALDDWIFMCCFVGNDFLPHLPSLDIREDGIDTLITLWRENIPMMGGYVTKDGHIDLARAQFILSGLAKQEDAIFRRRRETEQRKSANAKRRKIEDDNRRNQNRKQSNSNTNGNGNTNGRRNSPDYSPAVKMAGSGPDRAPAIAPEGLELFTPGKNTVIPKPKLTYESMVNRGVVDKANVANKSAAAVLKNKLLGKAGSSDDTTNTAAASDEVDEVESNTPNQTLGKRKADDLEADDVNTPDVATSISDPMSKIPKEDEEPIDNVRMWEEGYAERYYEQKFHADPKDIEFRHNVARSYVEGLSWVLLYYFQGCPSMSWYYPYHYAPFAADFVGLADMTIIFDKGTTFKPYEQLMGVFPAASGNMIPEPFRSLMTAEDSEILDFYPEEFGLDLNGKKWAWQGVVLLPFIDEKRLLGAMQKRYHLLTEEEHARNAMGRDVLIMSGSHPLYDDIAGSFYSKRAKADSYKIDPKISEGLAGHVTKHPDHLPSNPLVSPIEEGSMGNLEEDRSMMVYYDRPRTEQQHKSMLLRGVKMPATKLDRADIEATKNRATYGNRRGGRGGYRNAHNNAYNNNNSHDQGNRQSRNGQQRGQENNNDNNNRSNPFAAYVNPNYPPAPPDPRMAPPVGYGYGNGGGPQRSQGQYYSPPGPPMYAQSQLGYYQPPPPPSSGYAPPGRGGYGNGYPPSNGRGNRGYQY
ncbi:5'-3' exoribonuclease 2 [Agyrium rufum]|nr:5'-3' exoribonuclease 2 [Agyrium rufum]